MKKRNSTLLIVGVFTSLLLASCNGSKKGHWSEKDKENFRKDMEGVKELSNFGEHKTEWMNCYLSKCEANYTSYYHANLDEKGCEKFAFECNDEVLSNGSIKGKWSEKDKENFRKDMNEVRELSDFGEHKTEWIECYLGKAEANFASYYHANLDEKGCEEIASECTEEIFE